MSETEREKLRTLFATKTSESVNTNLLEQELIAMVEGDADPTKNIKFTDDDVEKTSEYTFGYGETTKSSDRDGDVIDNKYRILRPLGEGGASHVYLCERILIGDRVALKMLHTKATVAPELAQRFHREALAAAFIKHPNVITIHDFDFTDDGTPFIVMELLHGQTLLGEMRRVKQIALKRALQILTPICSALNVAHSRGIIHRDLKPANIVLHRMEGNTEIVKLIDFGIAKRFLEQQAVATTAHGMLVGTPAYMAPERCLEEDCDARADIYNLGLIFYEMIAGHHPFRAKTITAMMAKQISESPPSLTEIIADCPATLEEVIFKALAKSPQQRYASALEFAEALNNALFTTQLQH